MADLRVKHEYQPRGPFLPFHQSNKRWSCIVAHRRCGKTVACVMELLTAALSTKKTSARYAYIAPFYNQAKSIAWDYLRRYSAPLRPKVNETELSVELHNGAKIRLYGADNDQGLRGIYLDGVVLDEYADMRPRVWGEIVRPMLADRKGWAVFIGTPKGHNDFYGIYQRSKTDKDWLCLTLRASETKLLSDTELSDMRKGMTDEQYEQEMECSFEAAILGAFYGKELAAAEAQDRIGDYPHNKSLPVFTAWDLGWTDDTAIWFFQVIAGEVHLIDYYANNGEEIRHYADVVKAKPYEYAGHWVPHDAMPKTFAANGRSILQQLWELGLKAKVGPNLSLQDGIQAARLTLPRCWFHRETCNEGIEALKQYQREWDDDKKCFRDKPRHDWTSHAADAFRYLSLIWKEPVVEPAKAKPRFLHEATFNEIFWDEADQRPRNDGRI